MARQKLVHLHSKTVKAPSASDLNLGEIAVQHANEEAALYTKKNDGTVVKFLDEDGVGKLISAATVDVYALKTDLAATKTELQGVDTALRTDVDSLSGRVETIEGSVHTHDNKAVLDGITSEKVTSWDNAAASAHEHTNKALLDTYTQTETDLADAVAKKHEHANKAELDLIASGDKAKWDAAADSAHTHANKALLDTYTQTETDLADAVAKKHTHANASVLDGITAEKVTAWDGAVSGLENKVDKVEGKGLSTNDYTTAEKEKLASIAASAQTNVIETVKVNGTALTVTDKAVDILVAEGTANGTVKVNGVDVNVHGLGSAAYADTTAFDASGAANTVKTELIGDMTGETKTLGGLEDRIDALATGSNVTISTTATTENMLKSYTFSQNGSVIGTIDIPKDLVVTSGQIVEVNNVKYLRLTIANQSEPVDIAVSDLVDVYTQGNGIEISAGNEISAKVVAGNGLSLDANGIAMAAASSTGAGAMSAADFDKLASVAASAQVNTVEGVQVNGADLTPDANKKVNVTVTSGTNNGTIAVNGSDVAVTGLKSAAFEEARAFDAPGAAEDAKAAVIGDMTGDTKTLGALQDAIEGLHLGEDNVLEGVQVNGTDLTIDGNKKVNVTVAEGSADGTIAVNGSDVAVHGLKSAAFAESSAFDAAGAAAAASAAAVSTVVGTASDNSGATTVYGAKAYADQVAADAAANALTGATGDTLVSATAANNVVTVAATQDLQNAVTAANASVQGIETGKESGAKLNTTSRELDFSEFGIDCGEY